MKHTPESHFLLAGLALAAGLVAVVLWLGALQPAFTHFTSNVHTDCGAPVTMRAEGYNLLGGTRYGRDYGDPGDDVDLALVDFCHAAVQRLPNGEERLWFWLDIQTVGKTFPYYTWGIPELDIENPNANDWRDPVDPLWAFNSIVITNYAADSTYWTTAYGQLCPRDTSLPGIAIFFDSENAFRIPQGGRRTGWVCVRMSEGQPLPDTTMISLRPGLARLTRWVDKIFAVKGEAQDAATGALVQDYLLPTLSTAEDVCDMARHAHPESIILNGGCPYSGQ